MTKALYIIEKFNEILLREADSIDFKNKVTKERATVDKWSDDRKLDQFDDEKTGQTLYMDKEGNVLAVYSNKDKQLHTNIDKTEIDKIV